VAFGGVSSTILSTGPPRGLGTVLPAPGAESSRGGKAKRDRRLVNRREGMAATIGTRVSRRSGRLAPTPGGDNRRVNFL